MNIKSGDIIQISSENCFFTQGNNLYVWQETTSKTLIVKILEGSRFYGVYIKLHKFDNTDRDDADQWHDVLIQGQLYIVSTKQLVLVDEQHLYNK